MAVGAVEVTAAAGATIASLSSLAMELSVRALVLANVMAEITAVFPPQQRRLAMALNSSVLALGQVTGLLVGGLFIGSLGWRAIFLVAVAIGA